MFLMSELLKKPLLPADDDCCGGGACCPCVWDHYYSEHEKWRLQQAELQAKEQAVNAEQP
jgi:hypothetical protein